MDYEPNSRKKARKERTDYLSQENSKSLKGILAILIVLAHIRSSLPIFNNTVIGQILTASGYLCVGVFLFLSGYGLVCQYKKRGETYINQFPKKRILDLYVKYAILVLTYFLFYVIFKQKFILKEALSSLILLDNIVANGWYIQAIFLIYALFYVFLKFNILKSKMHLELTALYITIAYTIVFLIFGMKFLWLQSFLAFPLGILWAHKKDTIDKLMFKKRTFVLMLGISFIAFCITLLLGNYDILPFPLKHISKIFSTVFFCIFVVSVIKAVNISNKITKFLGSISFEIYVIHGLFLNLLSFTADVAAGLLYACLVYICSIISAFGLNLLFKKASKLIKE